MELHNRENSQENENHFYQNQERFSKQCADVLRLLKSGISLTTTKALQYGIGDLRRRIKDLKDFNGINVEWKWHYDETGKQTRFKEWFIPTPKVYPTKNDLQTWFNEFQQEQTPVISITRNNTFTQQSLFNE